MIDREHYLIAKAFLQEVSGNSQVKKLTVSRYWSSLRHWLLWQDGTPFSEVPQIRPSFPNYLASVETDDGEQLAAATARKVVQVTKRFLVWGKMNYPAEFKKMPSGWINSLKPPKLPDKTEDHVFVSLEEAIRLATFPVPEAEIALRRDQAGLALLFVSGMRPGALGSLPLQALDLANLTVKQWPKWGVRTKFGKKATTYLLNIPELLAPIREWDIFVRSKLPPTAMWYTPIISRWGEQILSPDLSGESRNAAIIKRTRQFYESVGLPYKSPHKMRHGHAVFALLHARTMADYKAVSQNLMHGDVTVTDGVYASLLSDEVQNRIAGLTDEPARTREPEGDLADFLRSLSKTDMTLAIHILADELAH